MKAVVCTQYGSPEVLQIREVKKPEPKRNEVLIKVFATSAHIGDTRIRRVDPFLVRIIFGLFKPKKNLILGLEVSGIVEDVGSNVTSFKAGDEVFALTGFGLGGYAEYRCLPEKVKEGKQERKGLVAIKPSNLSHEEAATVPAGALTALKNLQKAKISKGQKILINGASGSLGTYAIQLAKYYGAEVTAVCSGQNFDLVKSLGADHVIDYTSEDFTRIPQKFDVIYDAVMKSKASKCRKILKKNGFFLNNYRQPKIIGDDLLFLKDLIEKNILKPVIDKIYPVEEIVEAHRYVDKGHKKGNVAVTVYTGK
ncbi:MAG: NAD(P)-dependent alcohol dehydrogenase [Prolixibacteraceae bacterium]|jgi:NADPH:quinone reductase-like Zn-dependent oxidoreductase|nr:NAD(P)-dependent alcohol dehydrogenase [Prolixibacteraceae bacterium]